MTNQKTAPLTKKITKKERLEHRNLPQTNNSMPQSRRNGKFKYLFNILEQMNVFPTGKNPNMLQELKEGENGDIVGVRSNPIGAKLVTAMQLYEGEIFELSTMKNEELKKVKRLYKKEMYRVEQLRDGDASFMDKEADYFYEAFRLAFGNAWADTVTPLELVTGDARVLIRKLINDNVPVDWNTKDQLEILKLVIGSRNNVTISGEIKPYAKSRLSDAGNDLPKAISFEDERVTLQTQQEFQVAVLDIPLDEHFTRHNLLVLEYSQRPIIVEESNIPLKGQIHSKIEEVSPTHFVIKHNSGTALEASERPGRYGFILLLHSFSSPEELLGEAILQASVYSDDFNRYARKLTEIVMSDGDIQVIDLPYQVV